jgi:hypothetical protein
MTAMTVAAFCLAVQAATPDTNAATAPAASADTIDTERACLLIAKGPSGLEYNVAAEIKEHFENRGCSVETTESKKTPRFNLTTYRAVLVFDAVKKSRLTPPGRRILEQSERSEEDSRPIVFVSTISGRRWEGAKTKVDAVSAASDPGSAERIARRLIPQLQAILADTSATGNEPHSRSQP